MFLYNILYIVNNNNGDNMKIEDIMSKDLIIGDVNNTVRDIANKMKEYDIGFVPIAEDDQIIGVITDRDIVVNILDNNGDLNSSIGSYITRNIVCVEKDQPIDDAIITMGVEKIKRLLVTDNEEVVGVLSLSDIINAELDNELIVNNIKKIWEISRNNDQYNVEIDEFYL